MPTFAYPSGCSDFVCLMNYNNSISGFMFGNMMLFLIFMVPFITLLAMGSPKKAFTASSWITFMASLPMAAFGVVNGAMPIILVAVGLISLIPLFLDGR